jgi:hypothetical protein
MSHWNDVIAMLNKWYPKNPSVMVYPNADIQYAAPKDIFTYNEVILAQ